MRLENIRSYKKETVEFPLGKTLFEGDIGSGKSTILMAIEFAFFGLGSEKGASLLRSGESEGKVGLVFEVNGKEYTILRGLERNRRGVQQTDGELKTPEGRLNLSPTEMKEKILETLNFNEPPDPKAQSVVYRYAVFTPQEEMKTILFLRPDLRLQTLRKAFRIEDYKTAAENTKEILARIKNKAQKFEFAASDLPDLEQKIKELTGSIRNKQSELEEARKSEINLNRTLNGLLLEKDKLHKDEVKLSGARTEIIHLNQSIKDKNNDLEYAQKEIEGFRDKIERSKPKIKELEGFENPTEDSQEELRRNIDAQEKEATELRKIEMQIEAKMRDFESIQESGNCPTCDRPVNPEEFAEKISSKRAEKEDASKTVTECIRIVNQLKELLEKKRRYDEVQERLKENNANFEYYGEEIQKWNERVVAAHSGIEDASRKLKAAQKSLKRLNEVSEKINEIDADVKNCENELRTIRDSIAAAEATIQTQRKEIEEYNAQVNRKKNLQKRAELLREHQMWIGDYFLPTLDSIEKHVMLNINQDFNAHFQKWFNMLIEDPGKEARIDEDFTPIMAQDGYDQNIYFLSGGEKTSVALAYRLALNSIVQQVSTGMQSNLLILDEPTDGFSKEQLGKVREILDELQSPQIVIVSHEKELESFADQIFKVAKSQGVSKIVAGG
jgi:exonuclease SbcC